MYQCHRPNNFDGLRIEKTGIRNTDAITYQINQGEARVENLKNYNSLAGEMEEMMRDLNSKLSGLDDIKHSLKKLDTYKHTQSSLKNVRTSPCSGEILSKISYPKI